MSHCDQDFNLLSPNLYLLTFGYSFVVFNDFFTQLLYLNFSQNPMPDVFKKEVVDAIECMTEHGSMERHVDACGSGMSNF